MEKFFEYADFMISAAYLLIAIIVAVIFLGSWIGSKVAKKNFFKTAKESLKFSGMNETVKGITNDYEVYRKSAFAFKYKTIIDLCQELGHKLKLKADLEYIEKLEDVISTFKAEYRFDDEKMNEVISNIREKSGEDDARTPREYLIRLNAFHNGIISEKDRKYMELQEKMTRKNGLIGCVVL